VFLNQENSTSPSKLEFQQTKANQVQLLLQYQVSDYDHLTFIFLVEMLDFFYKSCYILGF